ncbi:MAG: hypothetical protein AAFX99_22680, partial [Myxococcota bacterium]
MRHGDGQVGIALFNDGEAPSVVAYGQAHAPCTVLDTPEAQAMDASDGVIALGIGAEVWIGRLSSPSSCPYGLDGTWSVWTVSDTTNVAALRVLDGQLYAATQGGHLYHIHWSALPSTLSDPLVATEVAMGLGSVRALAGDERMLYAASGATLWRVEEDAQGFTATSTAFPSTIQALDYSLGWLEVASGNAIYAVEHDQQLPQDPSPLDTYAHAVTALARDRDHRMVGMGSTTWHMYGGLSTPGAGLTLRGVRTHASYDPTQPLALAVRAEPDAQAVHYRTWPQGGDASNPTLLATTTQASTPIEVLWPESLERGRTYILEAKAQMANGTQVTSQQVPFFVRGDGTVQSGGDGTLNVSLSATGLVWPNPVHLHATVSSTLTETVHVDLFVCGSADAWQQEPRDWTQCTWLGTATQETNYSMMGYAGSGEHYFGARAVSAGGTTAYSNVVSLSRTADENPPTVTLELAPGVTTIDVHGEEKLPRNLTYSVIASAVDDGEVTVVAIERDGVVLDVGTPTATGEHTPTEIGSHTWEAFALDSVGRLGSATLEVEVVAGSPPSISSARIHTPLVQGIEMADATPVSSNSHATIRVELYTQVHGLSGLEAWLTWTAVGGVGCAADPYAFSGPNPAGIIAQSNVGTTATHQFSGLQLSLRPESNAGDYDMHLCVRDSSGNIASLTKEVHLQPNTAPDPTLVGSITYPYFAELGSTVAIDLPGLSGADVENPDAMTVEYVPVGGPCTPLLSSADAPVTLTFPEDAPCAGLYEFALRLRDSGGLDALLCPNDNVRGEGQWDISSTSEVCGTGNPTTYLVMDVRDGLSIAFDPSEEQPAIAGATFSFSADIVDGTMQSLAPEPAPNIGLILSDVTPDEASTVTDPTTGTRASNSFSVTAAGRRIYRVEVDPSVRNSALVLSSPQGTFPMAEHTVVIEGGSPSHVELSHRDEPGSESYKPHYYPGLNPEEGFELYAVVRDAYGNVAPTSPGSSVSIDLGVPLVVGDGHPNGQHGASEFQIAVEQGRGSVSFDASELPLQAGLYDMDVRWPVSLGTGLVYKDLRSSSPSLLDPGLP